MNLERYILKCLCIGFIFIFALNKQLYAQKKPEQIVQKEVKAVCIWEGASVRETPEKDAKWISTMALGEKVVWLDETVESSYHENDYFHKVRLSNGKEGWSSSHVLVLNAEPAVTTHDNHIYKRTDILTVTDQALASMEIIAVKTKDGSWLEIVSNKKDLKGWIRDEGISFDEIDIAVAKLIKNALAEKDKEIQIRKLETIANSPTFANSVFIPKIVNILESQKTSEINTSGTN